MPEKVQGEAPLQGIQAEQKRFIVKFVVDTMETNIIFNEDCMNTLQRLESNSIDLIVTSPPYNKNAYATDKGTSGF